MHSRLSTKMYPRNQSAHSQQLSVRIISSNLNSSSNNSNKCRISTIPGKAWTTWTIWAIWIAWTWEWEDIIRCSSRTQPCIIKCKMLSCLAWTTKISLELIKLLTTNLGLLNSNSQCKMYLINSSNSSNSSKTWWIKECKTSNIILVSIKLPSFRPLRVRRKALTTMSLSSGEMAWKVLNQLLFLISNL